MDDPGKFFEIKANRRTATIKNLQGLITPRELFSVCTFGDDFIFAIGGSYYDFVSARTEFYNIKNNTWTEVAALNKPRYFASSCALGDFIYSFFGLDEECSTIACMEILNANLATKGLPTQWKLVSVVSALSPRE